jgi:hypothetical protein
MPRLLPTSTPIINNIKEIPRFYFKPKLFNYGIINYETDTPNILSCVSSDFRPKENHYCNYIVNIIIKKIVKKLALDNTVITKSIPIIFDYPL